MGRRKIDLTGMRQGRWEVLGPSEPPDRPLSERYRASPWWTCKCACEKIKPVSRISLHAGSRSCGCLIREVNRERRMGARRVNPDAVPNPARDLGVDPG